MAALLSEELSALEELGATFGPFQATTAVFIFFKNAFALLFSFIFSPILCLLPILTLGFNGLLISYISVIVTQEASLSFLLAGLMPHGIFEIPALIIGDAAALRFGAMAIIALIFKDRRKVLLPSLKQNMRYLLLAIVMLIPAAIISGLAWHLSWQLRSRQRRMLITSVPPSLTSTRASR